ncbi:MAG: EAL domain-containing protein [Gallionella sp.]|nr:EAL domain-containing protein [Gallionella sp.]
MKFSDNNGLSILIAEDSRTQAEQLAFLLEQNGYEVTVAVNGRQALLAAEAKKYALLISDIVMPEMDGYELCRAIKADEKLKDIPVILVTTLSDAQDVIRGLECGADNFIRKPYEETYLLSRIHYLLMNLELRKNQKMQMGVEIDLGGHKYFINSERQQILDLLISTYEQAVHINNELKQRENELALSNQLLQGIYRIAEGLNHAITEREVAETALERALELPGVQSGWVVLWEEAAGFRLIAARNLPPTLMHQGALDGGCECRRRFLAGELNHASNIIECERLKEVRGDSSGMRYHASVPLWIGDRIMGVMNLVGAERGLFDDAALKILYGVGNQVAVALERARLHQHLEQLVEERTAALRASEDKLNRAQAVAQIGSWNLDIASRRLEWSAEAHRIFGIPGTDAVDLDAFVFALHPDDREMVLKAWGDAVAGAAYDIEHRIVAHGETRWVRERAIIERNAEGLALFGIGTTQDVTERRRIQDEQARLVAIIEATPDMVATGSPDGRVFYFNQAGLRMLGFEPEQDLSVVRMAETHPEWAAKLVVEEGIPHAIKHGSWSGETALLSRDGLEIPVSQVIIAHKGLEGTVEYLSTVARDITQRKLNEARIARLNRIYSVLSGINTTIVRVREEDELFKEACRIAVEHGRFIFAWIGKYDAQSLQVTPVTRAGRDDGYLAQINLTASDEAPGNCALTAQALACGEPVVCNNIAIDERMAPWRPAALSRGYRSVAVFPLQVEGLPVGVFVLYAAEADAFDDEEMKLLIEMAGDISFALDHLKKVEKLNYLAYYNAITGLPNRTLFYDRLSQYLHDLRSGETVAVLAIDLDRFREINETFGRHVGDTLLKQVAERLIDTAAGAGHTGHISADCFAMVLSNIKEEADVVRFLESQVTAALRLPFALEGQELRISARAGIAIFPGDGKDADSLYRNAEAALKKTKLNGDQYLFYTPEFNALVADKLMLENKLRRAIEQEQFVLYYQPKVNLKTGHIVGLEALIRWNDPETGMVPPGAFIPLLEETGMILEVGRWALEKAVADTRQWRACGLAPPRVAVNVSQVQLAKKDFIATVERVLGDTDAAQFLDLEITESLIMRDVEVNIMKLATIRKMGLELAIDDFGTGYSSLSYIARLPVNTLKIDRAFIINMTSNPDDLSIVSTIISLAHALNLSVVAEGVETREQANLLKLLKCDDIQGYLFSPAVPAAQIKVFLEENKSLLI